jgi:hypothetical protein
VRAWDVGNAGVDTDHEIERSETRGHFVEVGKMSNQIDDLVPFNEDRLVFGSRLLLQTDESYIDIQDGARVLNDVDRLRSLPRIEQADPHFCIARAAAA